MNSSMILKKITDSEISDCTKSLISPIYRNICTDVYSALLVWKLENLWKCPEGIRQLSGKSPGISGELSAKLFNVNSVFGTTLMFSSAVIE